MINIDKEHSDLVLAQTLIKNKDYSFAKISEQTGISEPTLKSYRNNPDKLETASWRNVRALAVLQVNAIVQEEVGMSTVLQTQKIVTSWFDEEHNAFRDDEQTIKMIKAMKDIVTDNPMALAKIAVALSK